jgi:hypothetical protein
MHFSIARLAMQTYTAAIIIQMPNAIVVTPVGPQIKNENTNTAHIIRTADLFHTEK